MVYGSVHRYGVFLTNFDNLFFPPENTNPNIVRKMQRNKTDEASSFWRIELMLFQFKDVCNANIHYS